MSDMACNGKAGVTCADDETQVTCALVAGTTNCFKITAGTAVTCSTNKSCPGANVGCVCDPQPACDGAANMGAGTYCDPANAPQGRYTCAAAADTCVIPGPAADCADPTVCAEATAGAATCVCPGPGTAEGTGCGTNTGVAPICSGDNSAVLHCTTVGACNVWTITTAEDDCAGQGGLVCENADCVCPETANEKTFFADPNVANRPASLLPTGVRFPAICTYQTLSLAVQRANAESLGFFRAYAVASHDSTPAGQPAVFDEETPLVLGPTISMITTEFPGICGTNCPGINPTNFVIKANNFGDANTNRGFITLKGNDDTSATGDAAQGPSLIGFTVESAPCRFGSDSVNCSIPEALVWAKGYTTGDTNLPNMAFNILNGTGGGLTPLLAQPAKGAFEAFAGYVPGGTLTTGDDGTFTYEFAFVADPNDPRFTDGPDTGKTKGFAEQAILDGCTDPNDPELAGTLALSITGSLNGDNDGFYFLDADNVDDSTVTGFGVVTDEDLPTSALAALWCLSPSAGDHTSYGLLVDHANGVFETTAYVGFIDGMGTKVEGTFGSGTGAVFSGGAWAGNLYGMYVSDWDPTFPTDANNPNARNTKVTVQGAPITNQAALFSGNMLIGLDIKDSAGNNNNDCDPNMPLTKANTEFTGTNLVVQGTFWARNPGNLMDEPSIGGDSFAEAFEEADYGLGQGYGIVVGNPDFYNSDNWTNGNPKVTLTNAEVSGNQIDGLFVGATSNCLADKGSITATTSTFDGNHRDGVHVWDFHGPITIAGGSASGNGYANRALLNDVWSFCDAVGCEDPNDPNNIVAFPAVQGNGITVDGCISGYANNDSCVGGFTLTSSGEGEAGRLQLSGNVVSGLWVDGSSVYVHNTDITGNGTASLCNRDDDSDRAKLDARGPALYTQNSGIVHVFDSTISGNSGTGAFFNSYSDNADRPNTMSGTTVTLNQAIHECDFDPDTVAWNNGPAVDWDGAFTDMGVGGGIFVAEGARVEATDDGVTVTANVRKGVYNDGSVTVSDDRDTEIFDGNDPVVEVAGTWTVTDNGGTGWYDGDATETTLEGAEISGNGAATDANDPSGNKNSGGYYFADNRGSSNTTTVTITGNTAVTGNTGQGVRVSTDDAADRVKVVLATISGNTSHGVYVTAAPGVLTGANDVNAVPLNVTNLAYGFVLDQSTVTGNMGDGVHLGSKSSSTQDARVLALIGGPTKAQEIFSNKGNGFVVEQSDPNGPSGPEERQTGASITNNRVHDNGKAGFEIWTSVIVPFDAFSGLGFMQNRINHNAMDVAGCVATQSAPQIFVRGPTAASGTTCTDDGTDSGACATDSDAGTNAHCVFSSTDGHCHVSHDLRGGHDSNGCGGANWITGYASGSGEFDIGLRAESASASNPSIVDARFNFWVGGPSTSIGQNAFVLAPAGSTCGSKGCTP